MSNRPSLDDYIDVAERIQDFKDAHPNGSLQTIGWEVVTVTGWDVKNGNKEVTRTFIVYRAAAYREAGDISPGHGIAWEPFPGGTPYTKDSELMNAETAAWGRAICALGHVTNRSLASRQEVRNRRADQEWDDPKPVSRPATRSKPNPQTKPANGQRTAPVASQPIGDGVLKQLRASFDAADAKTQENLPWLLLSVGVESLPENPSQTDIGTAMRSLTLEQAVKLEDLLTGDPAVPGSGESE